ncbi:MAG: LON peptidase substrate-binding domain-containing protein [Verrucomicrobiota bacterium]|nr:LON peptidase substrate-binding domain-containing protein [Verrucomicrobiota bacterium]MDQ6939018.1 LON peptidase substrate-binding domain-containing protein [Verrucomicrobiota bacterium]
MSEPISLPQTVPVMPLPGAVLFPHALLPLYIFEPRYREMLGHALAHDRMFSVALLRSKRSDWQSSEDFHDIVTVGLVRACVDRGDGTSNLILQGLQRVRFIGFEQEKPFPIAEIEPLESDEGSSLQVQALGEKVLELYRKLRDDGRKLPAKVDDYLSELSDPEMLADLIAATFITDPWRRQELLEELAIDRRLRLVIEYLRDETGHAAA